ncbi:HNH endonuclease [Tenacibaculum agarivorans]|uniref:HNH endonuclease n=1 Tax=Tenacibaculum agarivorans TaxID=1908389 RepID=UPI00094B9170|nr:HNH endonuclease [Tenacibaculum agarivorans]
MIKLEKGYCSTENKKKLISQLAAEHYNRVVEKKGTYVSPIKKLKEALDSERAITSQISEINLKVKFLETVTNEDEFKRLLTSPLEKFDEIIDDYKEFNPLFEDEGYKFFLDLFGYPRLRQLRLMYLLAKDLGIKACPYCNSNYILTIKKSKKANLHFDHFYSKSKYPYLSLNFYNLIPCCATCNTAKSNKDFNHKDYIHPYKDSFADKFDFITDRDAIFDMILNGNKDLNEMKVMLKPKKGHEAHVDRHDKTFNLSEIYNEHSDIVYEVYAKQYIYTEQFKSLIINNFEGKFSKEEINRFILGNYISTSEINKRPLSKLMQDIQKEAKNVIETNR